MARFEDAIRDYLISVDGVVQYVGQNIFYGYVETQPEEMFIRYSYAVANNPFNAFGDVTSSEPLIQFDIFGKDQPRVLECGYALMEALHGYYGPFDRGFTVSTSSATGPTVVKDEGAWYHGIVEWSPQYKR